MYIYGYLSTVTLYNYSPVAILDNYIFDTFRSVSNDVPLLEKITHVYTLTSVSIVSKFHTSKVHCIYRHFIICTMKYFHWGYLSEIVILSIFMYNMPHTDKT